MATPSVEWLCPCICCCWFGAAAVAGTKNRDPELIRSEVDDHLSTMRDQELQSTAAVTEAVNRVKDMLFKGDELEQGIMDDLNGWAVLESLLEFRDPYVKETALEILRECYYDVDDGGNPIPA